jgi:hypothetical protein
MTTGKLAAWGPSFARVAGFGGRALLRLATLERRRREGGSSQTISSKSELPSSPGGDGQLNILQTVVLTDQTHAAVSLRAFSFAAEPRTKE